jgi:DDE superfamily endonuclease
MKIKIKTTTIDDFCNIAKNHFSFTNAIGTPIFVKKFISMFGAAPNVVTATWNKLVIQDLLPASPVVQPVHLLWALLQIKVYPTDQVLGILLNVHTDTFRKYVWVVLSCIPSIKNVVSKYIYFLIYLYKYIYIFLLYF